MKKLLRPNMPSMAKLEANRLNALKSTGPRTPEGKARSSMNALKHGLRARDAVIPGEDPAEHEAFATWFFDGCAPATPLETCLVRQMITAEWRLRRIERLENGALFLAMEGQLDNFTLPEDPEELTTEFHQIAGRTLRIYDYELFNSYARTYSNMFQRAFRAFMRLRIGRQQQRGLPPAPRTKTWQTNPPQRQPSRNQQPAANRPRPHIPPDLPETGKEVA